jgi:prolyl oligopeptidase
MQYGWKMGAFAVPLPTKAERIWKKWHDAGTKCKKQNVFDDFIAAAELIAQKYTSSDFAHSLVGQMEVYSVGATMTQRPELMKVALPAVGVMDMLRYHTFRCRLGIRLWNSTR